VWVELLIRSSAVYVAVLFLPLALASLAWPAISHWCRRLVDTLVALILGKFVIVSVLSLAVGALAGGTGSTPGGASTAGGSGGGSSGGFGAVLGGAALLLLAGFAPWALFRLLPFAEAGAVGHLEALSHRARQTATAPIRGLAQTAVRMSAAGSLAGAAAGVGSRAAAGAATGMAAGVATRGGAGGAGGAGGGSGPGGRSGPGGGGGQGAAAGGPDPGPDPGPSSAESTGVGTMDAPGSSIPLWPVHPEATAVANQLGAMRDEDSPETPDISPTGAVGPLTPLPRQSGAFRADALGRDELGIRLVAAPTTPPNRSSAGTVDGDPRRPAGDG
jgi:hypothetical protein